MGQAGLHRVAIAAAGASLAVLTAAACVLSYPTMHDLAARVGVSPDLARVYPVLFDALLVIAGCAVLALRGAGLPTKLYAWICLVLLLAGLAAGSAADSVGVSIPQRPAEVAAAVIPWTLVLAGLVLLLLMLRNARLRRPALTSDALWLSPFAEAEAREELEAAEFVLTAEPLVQAAAISPGSDSPGSDSPGSDSPGSDSPDSGAAPEPPALLRPHSSPTPPGS